MSRSDNDQVWPAIRVPLMVFMASDHGLGEF